MLVDVQLDPVYLTNVLWNTTVQTKTENDDDAVKGQTVSNFDAARNNDKEHDETNDDDDYIIHKIAAHKARIRRFEVRLDVVDDGILASKSSLHMLYFVGCLVGR